MNKHISWWYWGLLTLAVGGYFTYALLADEQAPSLLGKRAFLLSGQTTSGHHQIELACDVCHTPFQGVKQEACLECHAEELKIAEDSHPKRKFTDPRNADRVALLDARLCITCHREHKPEITRAMGVTQPDDSCFLCHCDIADERPSHAGLKFDTCASAGCHNFHDNRALYEDFLIKHFNEIYVKNDPRTPQRNLATMQRMLTGQPMLPLTLAQQDAPPTIRLDSPIAHDWEQTAHAAAGVNCGDCHGREEPDGKKASWANKVSQDICGDCHADQVKGFLASKHGMRLKEKLSPMRPALARLPMKSAAQDKELGCTTCHKTHRFDTRRAAVESCLDCHDDNHSRAYKRSPHYTLWQAEIAGELAPGSGVSCATCHLPREVHQRQGLEAVQVQHNQNDNLRPNEKMLRSVCLNCHGLGFSIDSLAELKLIDNNFTGAPTRHVESLDWAERRFMRGLKRDKSRTARFKRVSCDPKFAKVSD